MPFHFIKEVRDIKRLNQILLVLFEEGFDFLLARMNLSKRIPLAKRVASRLGKKEALKPEVRLRKTFERLGPTFIKFGQVLSVRPDLIPSSYSNELEKLQDCVPAFSYAEVEEIVEKEFGKSIAQLFLSFGKKPIASASISQVHKAVLKTGEKVAVKVQRPNVKNIMETDIEIMLYFANLLEKQVEKFKIFKPVKVVNEFREWTEKELDFRLEARNAKRFRQNFMHSKTVRIPKIYDQMTSERVLTMEFIEGVELHNFREIKRRKLNFNEIIRNSFDAIMTQVFMHGIFHADPHPGNIIILKGNSIAFIDFGIVGYFGEKLKDRCIDLLHGIVEQDEGIVTDALIGIGIDASEVDYEQLKSDIGFIIQPLQQSSINETKVSKVLEEIIELGLKHNFRMPPQFVLFGKTIITLEGIAVEFDPNFKIAEAAKPFVEKIIAKRSNPAYILKNFVHNLNRYRKFAEEFPEKAEKALEKIEKGTIKVDIEDTDIRKLALEIDRSSNRVAYGLLTAALLITAAILISIQTGPKIFGVPLLSFLSFLFASAILFVLFASIVREKFIHW